MKPRKVASHKVREQGGESKPIIRPGCLHCAAAMIHTEKQGWICEKCWEPCPACEEWMLHPDQQQSFGVCPMCAREAVIWAAKQARKEK